MTAKRVRRSREDAQRLILEAAEELLVQGGPAAVNVTAVAHKIGVTDAAVNHHFGGRDQLLQALLRHGGRRLRATLEEVARSWADGPPDIGGLIELLAEVYTAGGYSQLATALHMSGWRDTGSAFLQPIVNAIHSARCRHADNTRRPHPPLQDTQLAVAALHHAIATDAVFGEAFRRSAGLTTRGARAARQQQQWWTTTLRRALF